MENSNEARSNNEDGAKSELEDIKLKLQKLESTTESAAGDLKKRYEHEIDSLKERKRELEGFLEKTADRFKNIGKEFGL